MAQFGAIPRAARDRRAGTVATPGWKSATSGKAFVQVQVTASARSFADSGRFIASCARSPTPPPRIDARVQARPLLRRRRLRGSSAQRL